MCFNIEKCAPSDTVQKSANKAVTTSKQIAKLDVYMYVHVQ